MSASNSTVPAIILAVVILAMLIAFLIADRSGPSMASSEHENKDKSEMYHSSGAHSGFSGSLEDYLDNH